MEIQKMSRRSALRLFGVGAIVVLASACTPKTEPETSAKEVVGGSDAAKTAGKEWRLLIEMGSSTPTDPTLKLPEGVQPTVGIKTATDEYMAEHPNIKIDYYHLQAGQNMEEWLHARIAAQDCPDTWKYNADSLWAQPYKEWALDIKQWWEMPNPYMEGGKPWPEYFEEVARVAEIGPDGGVYGVCMNGSGTLAGVNVDMLNEVGVTEMPVTFTDYEEVWKKLKEAGYFGWINISNHWNYGHYWNQLAYDVALDFDSTGDKILTAQELVYSSQMDKFPIWDVFVECAKVFKLKVPYLPDGWRGFPAGHPGDAGKKLFRQGQGAMLIDSVAGSMGFKKDPVPFKLEWIPLPLLSKDRWPKSPEKQIRKVGAWGSLQPHLPAYLPKTDPERIPVIIDYIMWLSQPKYVESISAEVTALPFVIGAKADPWIAPWQTPYDRAEVYQSWAMVGGDGNTVQWELMSAFMNGDLNENQLLEKAKPAWDEVVRKSLEANPDWKV